MVFSCAMDLVALMVLKMDISANQSQVNVRSPTKIIYFGFSLHPSVGRVEYKETPEHCFPFIHEQC